MLLLRRRLPLFCQPTARKLGAGIVQLLSSRHRPWAKPAAGVVSVGASLGLLAVPGSSVLLYAFVVAAAALGIGAASGP